MLRIFIGFDHRQPISLNVLQNSIYRNSSKPVAITPLVLNQLPLKRQGLTPFTFSRFLVPYLCNYEGWGLFLDSDMLVTGDIAELFACADDSFGAMVVKNVKKFEWASAILFNCKECKMLTPEYIENAPRLHDMSFLRDDKVGALPAEWNHLVGYDAPKKDVKLIHYTQGVPAFRECVDCEHSDTWSTEHYHTNFIGNWKDLMGNSVHAGKLPDGTLAPLYKVNSSAA